MLVQKKKHREELQNHLVESQIKSRMVWVGVREEGKKGLVGVSWIEMKYSGAMREDGGEKRPIEDH